MNDRPLPRSQSEWWTAECAERFLIKKEDHRSGDEPLRMVKVVQEGEYH